MKKRTALFWLRLFLFCALLGAGIPPATQGIQASSLPLPPATQPQPPLALQQKPTTQNDALPLALAYLRSQRMQWRLTEADLADVVIKDRYITQHNGVTHLYLRQRYQGIELFNGDINMTIDRNGVVIHVASRFVADLAAAVNSRQPTIPAQQAILQAAQQLRLQPPATLQVIEKLNGPAQALRFAGDNLSQRAIPAKLMYQKQADGTVRLVWNTLLYPPNRENVWLLNLDALTGSVLLRQDLIVHERMNRSQTSAAGPPIKHQGSLATQRLTALVIVTPTITPTITPTTTPLPPEAGYRVLPMPLENPEDGPGLPSTQSVVFDPADPVASPFGWHDVDGVVGAEFYETRGNNVTAQEDLNADDMGGQRAAPSTPGKLVFDYAFNPAQEPDAGHNQTAALVNLFYWNNLIHDLFYRYGFDEAAGNFQENTYARGGLGGDAVVADAQDGSGTDNANFFTPIDGEAPRMQMYRFTTTSPNRDSDLDNGIFPPMPVNRSGCNSPWIPAMNNATTIQAGMWMMSLSA